MRIDLIEKLVFVTAVLTAGGVGAGVTAVSILFPGGLRSGISDSAENADQSVLDWLQNLRVKKGLSPNFKVEVVPALKVGQIDKATGEKITEAKIKQIKKESVTKYWAGDNNTVAEADRARKVGWLRRVPGVSYKPVKMVSRLTYKRYQSFQDSWKAAQAGGGEFVETEYGPAYKVNWINDKSRMAKTLGLQQNDQVISVNGIPVGKDVGAGKEMYNQLKGQRKFAVMILRNGKQMVLPYTVAN